MLLMGMERARNSNGNSGSKDAPVASNDGPSNKSSALPVLKQRMLEPKNFFTQSYREPSTLSKKPHHGSGTFTLSTDVSCNSTAKSSIPILVDRPKFTRAPLKGQTNKPEGGGIHRSRVQSMHMGARFKQITNVHDMHLHPKQRTGKMTLYAPAKFPSLPQISGETRIPLPRAAPPSSSQLPILAQPHNQVLSPSSRERLRKQVPPPTPKGAKFHRSESLRADSSHVNATDADGISDAPRARRNPHTHRPPMTPQNALKDFGHKLTLYEQKEIMEYPEVWFLGMDAKKVDGIPEASQNSGFDDDNGSYIKVLHDHIAYRYEIREVIGKGSFGQVVKCFDHKINQPVAIKIIRNKKRFHHQALVEVKILDSLRKKDRDNQYNIIHMIDYFYFRNHLCITFELMGMNMYELIKKNNFQGFSVALIRRFAYALLQCLKLLARERIIHCDLKPENILLRLKGQSQIKVIDFGSSCYDHQRVYTYIQSRFYRSPEVILGMPYSMAIDMWSFGAILAELYTGYPLFPGENEVEQLACIMEIFGPPSTSILAEAQRRKLFFDSKGNPRCITNSKGRKRRPGTKDFSSAIKTNDELFLNFLSQCLEWDPAKRLTPELALQHEWILEGRSRTVPRVLPISTPPSSSSVSESNPALNSSHLNGHHADTTSSSSKHSTSTFNPSKKRLQPIGADAKPRATERLLNGISKRSSLVVESSTKDTTPKKGLTKQLSHDSRLSSLSTNQTTKDISSSTSSSSSSSVARSSQAVQSKFLPRLV